MEGQKNKSALTRITLWTLAAQAYCFLTIALILFVDQSHSLALILRIGVLLLGIPPLLLAIDLWRGRIHRLTQWIWAIFCFVLSLPAISYLPWFFISTFSAMIFFLFIPSLVMSAYLLLSTDDDTWFTSKPYPPPGGYPKKH